MQRESRRSVGVQMTTQPNSGISQERMPRNTAPTQLSFPEGRRLLHAGSSVRRRGSQRGYLRDITLAHRIDLPSPMDRDDLIAIVSLYWLVGRGPDGWTERSLLDGTVLRTPAGVRIVVLTSICSFLQFRR